MGKKVVDLKIKEVEMRPGTFVLTFVEQEQGDVTFFSPIKEGMPEKFEVGEEHVKAAEEHVCKLVKKTLELEEEDEIDINIQGLTEAPVEIFLIKNYAKRRHVPGRKRKSDLCHQLFFRSFAS